MRALKLLTFALFSVVIFSCSSSDDCVQLDWVGTYTGTAVCNGEETTATVTIVASGTNEIQISYDTPTVFTSFDPIPIENCSANRSSSLGGVEASVSASLDGDKFTLTERISGGGFDTDCVVNATRD